MGIPNRSKERRSLIDSEAKVKMGKTKKSKKRRSKPRIERKRSLPRAIDTKWCRIVHEYELELARTGKQGFLMPQNLVGRLLQITHDKQKDQAGVLVPEAEGRGAREAANERQCLV
ncbi:hypothetical protein C5167_029108 [Papaver somniferum]|nr:hypothetical protein C5167_029108 [Papaver somniferum]